MHLILSPMRVALFSILVLAVSAARADEFRTDSLVSEHFYDYYTVDGVREAIAAGSDVNARDSFGSTPLMRAAWEGQVEALDVLLEAGADMTVRAENGSTVFHAAADNSQVSDKLVALLTAHADFRPELLDVQNEWGLTPVMVALQRNQIKAATLMIDAGADTKRRTPQGKTALDFARKAGASGIVAKLEGPPAPEVAAPAASGTATPEPAAGTESTATATDGGAAFTIPDHPGIASDLLSGKPYDFDDISQSVTAGVASVLLEECRVDLTMAERLEVVDFVKSATLAAAMGTDYSNPDLGKTFASQQAGIAQYTAGVVAVRTMGCAGEMPSRLARQVLETIRFNRKGSGGEEVFLDSCSNRHNAAICGCVLTQGMAVDANLAGQTYSQSLMQGLIERNPMIGMVMIMQCGLTEY